MCGIAGFVGSIKESNPTEALHAMAAAIAHRGPDDEGFFQEQLGCEEAQVGLAHRRLAIIDLTSGHQPVGNEDGSVQVVFNGEIYNFEDLRGELEQAGHLFRTKTDTEVIVHGYEQWGVECVNRFRGMFAFAIWDRARQRLVLARDRFGKKPLFWCKIDNLVLFASEIKAILSFPGVRASVNREALWDYFCYRYVPQPDTMFQGIRKLESGTYMVWERNNLAEHRYYYPPDGHPRRINGEVVDPVGAFLSRLEESVQIRMISDVPFGAFLSGGIDSSAVVALMSRHSDTAIRTFSVGFAESQYSELKYAKTVAETYRTDHHELLVSSRRLIDHLRPLVRFRDAPIAEPSDIPIYLLAKEARHTVKMVLTGEGADEMLGGYPKHVYERYAAVYQKIPSFFRTKLLEPGVAALPYGFRRAKTAITALGLEDRRERMQRWFGALTEEDRRQLLNLSPNGDGGIEGVGSGIETGNSALRSILYFDQTSWLPDNLLERGDRMTMAASLEARMPFMDHELADFISGLPDKWRVRGTTTKRILREAVRRLLPAKIIDRPKVGFRVPVNEWFRGPLREYLLDHVVGPSSITKCYYRPDRLRALLNEHINGRRNHEKLLWSMLTLEIWHREYRVAA